MKPISGWLLIHLLWLFGPSISERPHSDGEDQDHVSSTFDDTALLQSKLELTLQREEGELHEQDTNASMLQKKLNVHTRSQAEDSKEGAQDISLSVKQLQNARFKNLFHRWAYSSHQLSSITGGSLKSILPGVIAFSLLLLVCLSRSYFNCQKNSPMADNSEKSKLPSEQILGSSMELSASKSSPTTGQPKKLCMTAFAFIIFVATSVFFACWYVSLAYRTEFIHIPKNAGTAIEAAGWAQGRISWGAKMAGLSDDQTMPDGNTCSKYHVPRHMLSAMSRWYLAPASGVTTVCVTRHPFDRMVSEYRYLLEAPWGMKYSEQFNLGFQEFQPCTLEGFNHFVHRALTVYKSGMFYLNDCHQIPQTEYIWDPDGNQMCTDILRIEDLPDSFNAVMAREGYGVRLTSHHDNSARAECPNIKASSLSELNKAMIADVYTADFKLLNYSARM